LSTPAEKQAGRGAVNYVCASQAGAPDQVLAFGCGMSLAVGTEGLNHTVHIAEKSRNVRRIQDCSVGKAGGTQSSDISGSNLTGIARYFFRETQQLFKLRINRSSAIIGHQRVR